jgi:hypothetical protein
MISLLTPGKARGRAGPRRLSLRLHQRRRMRFEGKGVWQRFRHGLKAVICGRIERPPWVDGIGADAPGRRRPLRYPKECTSRRGAAFIRFCKFIVYRSRKRGILAGFFIVYNRAPVVYH